MITKKNWKSIGIILLVKVGFGAYPTYDGCPDLTDQDFEFKHLVSENVDVTLSQPLRMTFYQDVSGNANIYFVERQGKIKYYDASQSNVSEVGSLTVTAGTEAGLFGITLDPDFEENKWMYLMYTPVSPSVYRLSRFTITGNNTLDKSTEKILFEVPDKRQRPLVHTGGAMEFDKNGDLWITLGEHQASHTAEAYHSTTQSEDSAEDEAPDTYSLYGSLLRIHPEDDGTYSIPDGNFGEFWADVFKKEGRLELGQKYENTSLVRPEIYAKGFRNPYTMTLDHKTGWVALADCQGECKYPNWNGVKYECPKDEAFEEHHIIKEPAYYGWPYFQGNNHPFAVSLAAEKDPMTPVNSSPFRKGVDTLPPAQGATYTYNNLPYTPSICAMGGTVLRYDRNKPASEKMPPHFDGVYLVTDFGKNWLRALDIDSSGGFNGVIGDIFASINPSSVNTSITLDLRQGPDGSLYMLSYGTYNGEGEKSGIYKVVYKGDCQLTSIDDSKVSFSGDFKIIGEFGYVPLNKAYSATFYDVSGNVIFAYSGKSGEPIPLKSIQGLGVVLVKVNVGGSIFMHKIVNLKNIK